MRKAKTFVKKTKKGNVLNIVGEHYLRDDIGCGFVDCEVCSNTDSFLLTSSLATTEFPHKHILIPDSNVFLQHIDVMEHPRIKNVIVLQTVLDEIKLKSLPIYNRVRAIIENKTRCFYVFLNEHHRDTYIEREKSELVNDRNDRAILLACKWYAKHLESKKIEVVLLTEDEESFKNEQNNEFKIVTVKSYVSGIQENPELMDIVSKLKDVQINNLTQKSINFEPYLSQTELEMGIKSGRFLRGAFNVSAYNCLQANVIFYDGKSEPVLVKGLKDMNRAISGDSVVVQILPKEEWKRSSLRAIEEDVLNPDEVHEEDIDEEPENMDEPVKKTGKIVGIMRRSTKQYCGSIDLTGIDKDKLGESNTLIFVPVDKRIPRIKIHSKNLDKIENMRIVVGIDTWDENSRSPEGHYIRTIGPIGNLDVETEVILLEHDVPFAPFSPQVLECLPSPDWTADAHYKPRKNTEEDGGARIDLRHLNVCSVDPPGCTDIDDALHSRLLPNGNYEIGVHIADVSHFVRPGNAMDKEAAKRGTTVYFVNRRIDMLPELLGSNLCSLRANVDRFTFSCIWEITPEGEVLNVKFMKTVVHSRAAFTYAQAQERIDNPECQDEITKSLRVLNEMAKKFRMKRLGKGALVLASPEVSFKLENDSHDPLEVEMKELKEVNAMIEEFMLLANIYTAKKIYQTFPQCSLLRRHPIPPASNFDALVKAVAQKGATINYKTNKELADSLDSIKTSDPFLNKLIRMLATRCMLQAIYFCSGTQTEANFLHFGLAMDIYTHFTSPIRRYSDVIVHRLLAASIGADSTYPELVSKDSIARICDNLNRRHRMAQRASRASIELYTVMYFKNKILEEEARVIRIMDNGFVVLIPRYGVEGIIKTTDSNGKPLLKYNPKNSSVVNGNIEVKIFDSVVVQIRVEGTQKQQVNFTLVKPVIPGLSVKPLETSSISHSEGEVAIISKESVEEDYKRETEKKEVDQSLKKRKIEDGEDIKMEESNKSNENDNEGEGDEMEEDENNNNDKPMNPKNVAKIQKKKEKLKEKKLKKKQKKESS